MIPQIYKKLRNAPYFLDKEEEKKVISAAQIGVAEAMEMLVENNIRHLIFISNSILNSKKINLNIFSFDDILSAVTIKFIESVKTFDTSKEANIRTYSKNGIWQHVYKYFKEHEHPIQIPLYKEDVSFEYIHIDEVDEKELSYELDNEEIENRIRVENCLEFLKDEKDRKFLKDAFGIDTTKMNGSELALHIGVSRQRVDQKRNFLLKKIRAEIKRKELERRKVNHARYI